jgi:hypothetical protein
MISAKRKGMRDRNLMAKIPAWLGPFIVPAPAYRGAGPGFMLGLKKVLSEVECGPGHGLRQKQFGELLGVARSTVHDWSAGNLPDQMRALLCGLERLPEPDQQQFLAGFRRHCPRLEDWSISHDPGATGLLNTLLAQPVGLTLFHGESRRQRTFVVNALGNHNRRLRPERRICGLDLYDEEKFAGVPGMLYLRRRPGFDQERNAAMEMWQLIRKVKCDIVILNGVYSAAPDILPDVIKISKRRHVILADDFPNGLPNCGATVVAVTKDSPKAGLLRISAQQAGWRG